MDSTSHPNSNSQRPTPKWTSGPRPARRAAARVNPCAKPYGISGRMSAVVVVEIRKDVQPFTGARGEPLCPFVQPLIRISPAVLLRAEMKPHIDEGADDELARGRALHVVETERDRVAAQEIVDAFVVPTRIPEFDDMAIRARQRAQEDLEALQVQRPPRRQLIEDRAQPRAELLRVLEESRQRILGVLQLLHVREEPAGLDGVEKMRRRLLAPFRKRPGRRQAIKAVVDLDRIECQRVVREPA